MDKEEERRRLLVAATTRPKRARSTKAEKGRHVPWTKEDASHYDLVRPGIPLANPTEADHLFETKTIQEAHLYLWKHKDPHLQRNPNVPQWEATYFFENRQQYARVKKCHLKVAYQGAGRISHDDMWLHDAKTGLPYWVDRYAFSKLKQKSSKRKYEDNKRAADKESATNHSSNTE